MLHFKYQRHVIYFRIHAMIKSPEIYKPICTPRIYTKLHHLGEFTVRCIIPWGDWHTPVADTTVWCDPNDSSIISHCVKTAVNKNFI